MTSRTNSVQSAIASSASYFEYEPSSCHVSPLKPRKQSNVHCLDAFHERPESTFEYPPNAGLYARRALPPLPPPLSALPALHKCTSSDSIYSGSSSRPSTAMTNRVSCEKSLPPLPLQECPFTDSVASKHGDVENNRGSRSREARSTSFRGLFNRNSAAPSEDVPSLASSMSSVSTRDSRSDSVCGDYALTKVTTNGTAISSATSGRRPSTLSLTQLRAASKKASAAPPPLPLRPTSGRKHSTSAGSGHRWNPFGQDKEDIPPMPITPPFVQELSFTQCYYFYARNCHGYVLNNGANGDACENCAGAGYLGSP